MTHDHEAIQLAVASLDFELTPAERTRMEAGPCRLPRVRRDRREPPRAAGTPAAAAGARCLADRPPTRDARALVPPRTVAVAGAVGRRSPPRSVAGEAPPWGAFRNDPLDSSPTSRRSLLQRSVTSSRQSRAGRSIRPRLLLTAAAPRSGPRCRATPSPRSCRDVCASDPSPASPTIRPNTSRCSASARDLMILDGPVEANDYDWYQVAAWDPKDREATFPAGWVARGDHDGTPWISAAAQVCPTGTVTTSEVVGLAPAERVACFGDRELRLRAFVTDGSDELRVHRRPRLHHRRAPLAHRSGRCDGGIRRRVRKGLRRTATRPRPERRGDGGNDAVRSHGRPRRVVR